MTTPASPPDTRTAPPETGAERPMLEAYLDFHRETFRWKCAQLSDDELKRYAVPTSRLTLLGMLRHLTDVERWWFLRFVGPDPDPTYFSEEKPNDDFDALDTVPPADVLARWDAEVRACRQAVAPLDLDAEFTDKRGNTFSLRWVYLHMIEEYARHNGHADLIREGIDGVVGE
jgi:uncharacterized damage-inducible protein DinB